MKYTIEVIPHDKQSYETCGDWKIKDGNIHIFVSSMNNWKYELLVALHELVEVVLCKNDGVTAREVTAFDLAFEKKRVEGNHDEPGDDVDAPYQKQHNLATGIERIMAAELGVKWSEYEKRVNGLCQTKKTS